MKAYIVRRLIYMIPILIGVTLITFVLFNVISDSPAYQFAGKKATPETIAALEKELGLDRPLWQQYLFYLKQVVTFDFGRSWSSNQKISTMIADGIGVSLSLSVPPFLLSTLLSIMIALFLAYKRGTYMDKSIMSTCIAMMSISFLVYIIFFQWLFAYKLGWFPISGYDPSLTGRWQYLILPGIIWITVAQGSDVLLYRTIMMDEVNQDYVRTARAKGLAKRQVYFKHILKNALIPIITTIIIQIPFLITGSLLLEYFFGIPGLGGMMIQAINNSDFPVIKAMTFIGSFLYIIFNLLSDIAYTIVDPRVRLK